MTHWEHFFLAVVGVGLLFWAFYMVKHNRQVFTRENFSKSFYTLGLLALFLSGVIFCCIWLLRL